MDRFCLDPSLLGYPFCGAASWGSEGHPHPLRDQDAEDESSVLVLPTPGPPVITASLDESTSPTASRCDSERVFPVRLSTQVSAFATSMLAMAAIQPRVR